MINTEEIEQIRNQLIAWVANGSLNEKREEAKVRILAYIEQAQQSINPIENILGFSSLSFINAALSLVGNSRTRLDLSDLALFELPPCLNQLPDLKHLLLSKNRLNTQNLDFSVLPYSVETLNLSENNLISIRGLDFRHLTQLRELNLSKNRISNIEGLYLNDRFITIDLSENHFKMIPSKSLIPDGAVIFLYGNLIPKTKIREYYEMNIADRPIIKLSFEDHQLEIWVNTGDPANRTNRLEVARRISEYIDRYENIDSLPTNHLSLAGLGLTSLPNLSKLPGLKHLDLANNLLGKPNQETGEFIDFTRALPASLQTLILRKNNLFVIDHLTLNHLSNLRDLNIEENAFTHIPQMLLSFPPQTNIFLARNSITLSAWNLFQYSLQPQENRYRFLSGLPETGHLFPHQIFSQDNPNFIVQRLGQFVQRDWYSSVYPASESRPFISLFLFQSIDPLLARYFDVLALSPNLAIPSFRLSVVRLFDRMKESPAVLDLVSTHVAAIGDTCHDGYLLTFEKIQRALFFLDVRSGLFTNRIGDLLTHMRQQFRKEALKKFIDKKIENRPLDLLGQPILNGSHIGIDLVETELYLLRRLRLPLRLDIEIQKTSFAEDAQTNLTGLTEQDAIAAEQWVKQVEHTNFLSFLANHDAWQKFLEQSSPEKYALADTARHEAIEEAFFGNAGGSQGAKTDQEKTVQINEVHFGRLTQSLLSEKSQAHLLISPWGDHPRLEPWMAPDLNANFFAMEEVVKASAYQRHIIFQLDGDAVTARAAQNLFKKHQIGTTLVEVVNKIERAWRWDATLGRVQFVTNFSNLWQGVSEGEKVRISFVGHDRSGLGVGGYSPEQLLVIMAPILKDIPSNLAEITFNIVSCQGAGTILGNSLFETFPAKLAQSLPSLLGQRGFKSNQFRVNFRLPEIKVDSNGRKWVFINDQWISSRGNLAEGQMPRKLTLRWREVLDSETMTSLYSLRLEKPDGRHVSERRFERWRSQIVASGDPNTLFSSAGLNTIQKRLIFDQNLSLITRRYNEVVANIRAQYRLEKVFVATGHTRRLSGSVLQAELIDISQKRVVWKEISVSQQAVFSEFKNTVATQVDRFNQSMTGITWNGVSQKFHFEPTAFSRSVSTIGTWVGGFLNSGMSLYSMLQGAGDASITAQIQVLSGWGQGGLNAADDLIRLSSWLTGVIEQNIASSTDDVMRLFTRFGSSLASRLPVGVENILRFFLNLSQQSTARASFSGMQASLRMAPLMMGANLAFNIFDLCAGIKDLVAQPVGPERNMIAARVGMSTFNLLLSTTATAVMLKASGAAAIGLASAAAWATAATTLNVASLALLPIMIAMPFYLGPLFVNGAKYDLVINQMNALMLASQNSGFLLKENVVYQIDPSLPVRKIDFLEGKIVYADVYITTVKGGSGQTVTGGVWHYGLGPSVAHQRDEHVSVWQAYGFNQNQVFSPSAIDQAIVLPAISAYDLRAQFAQTTSNRYVNHPSMQKIADYYNGEQHLGEATPRKLFLYKYFEAFTTSDTGIVDLRPTYYPAALQVILDDHPRQFIIPTMNEKSSRDHRHKYEFFGNGGRYSVRLCPGAQVDLTPSAKTTEQWFFSIDAMPYEYFDHEAQIKLLQNRVTEIEQRIVDWSTMNLYTSMGTDGGAYAIRDGEIRRLRLEKSQKEIELTSLQAQHGFIDLSRPKVNFYTNLRFSLKQGFRGKVLNIGGDEVYFHKLPQQPLILTRYLNENATLFIQIAEQGAHSISILMKEMNREAFITLYERLREELDFKEIVADRLIALTSSIKVDGIVQHGWLHLPSERAKIISYDSSRNISTIVNMERAALSSELPLQSSLLLNTGLHILPAENGKEIFYMGRRKRDQFYDIDFYTKNQPLFSEQIQFRMKMLRFNMPDDGTFDLFWEKIRNQENTINTTAPIEINQHLRLNLSSDCLIEGITKDRKKLILKNQGAAGITLISAQWSVDQTEHLYQKIEEEGEIIYSHDIQAQALPHLILDQDDDLNFLGRHRAPVAHTTLMLDSETQYLTIKANRLVGKINFTGGAPNLHIILMSKENVQCVENASAFILYLLNQENREVCQITYLKPPAQSIENINSASCGIKFQFSEETGELAGPRSMAAIKKRSDQRLHHEQDQFAFVDSDDDLSTLSSIELSTAVSPVTQAPSHTLTLDINESDFYREYLESRVRAEQAERFGQAIAAASTTESAIIQRSSNPSPNLFQQMAMI